MERVARAGDPLRARAGTCGGSARGPNSGWKVPRQGCREGVCGCAGLIRLEELVLGADEGVSAHVGARANKCYTCERDKKAIACSSRRSVQTSQVKSKTLKSIK